MAGEESIVSHFFENGVLYAIHPGGIRQVTPEHQAAVEALIQLSTALQVYDAEAPALGSSLASASAARPPNANVGDGRRHAPAHEGLGVAAKPPVTVLQASAIQDCGSSPAHGSAVCSHGRWVSCQTNGI
jgi:hypothetical protein